MKLDKISVLGSPYIGIFSVLTDDFFLAPMLIAETELNFIQDVIGLEVIKATLASSSLNGLVSIGLENKLVVSELVSDEEIVALEENSIEVMKLNGVTALGNLAVVNDFGGVCSNLLSIEQSKKLSDFFEVPFIQSDVAETGLTGSCIVANKNGFITHPDISENEMKILENILKTEGVATTANYGDKYVGNSVLANSKNVLTGLRTSGPEMARIDDAFIEK